LTSEREDGQAFERFADAQLLLDGAGLVTKQATAVFAEAAAAWVYVHGRALGREQPAPFFGIRRRALAGEAG
jgi:hypothetical protein